MGLRKRTNAYAARRSNSSRTLVSRCWSTCRRWMWGFRVYEGFDSTEESVFVCFYDLSNGFLDCSSVSETAVEFRTKVIESSLKDEVVKFGKML